MILFSWEFPPRVVGQLSDYVNKLAVELVKKSLDVHVVTYSNSLLGFHQGADGVKAHRITEPVKPQINILTWVLNLNQEVEKASADIYYSAQRKVDIIDVQDWHFVPAAVTVKKALGIPFVYSIDSIENHRSQGSIGSLSLAIKSLESLGADEANGVVVKSDWMKQEVVRSLKVSSDKIETLSPDSASWIDDVLKIYGKTLKVNAN